MAKTAQMRLLELIILKQDISKVIEYIGRKESFQFITRNSASDKKIDKTSETVTKQDISLNANISESDVILDNMTSTSEIYDSLRRIATELEISLENLDLKNSTSPNNDDKNKALEIVSSYNQLRKIHTLAIQEQDKINSALKEALAFANLQVSYSELEHVTFLSLRIGKIPSENFDSLKSSLSDNAIIVALGDDRSHVLIATSKKGSFSVDSKLKENGFVELEIPQDFKGVPENAISGLKKQQEDCAKQVEEIENQKIQFKENYQSAICELICTFAIAVQIDNISKNLESTKSVYRLTGWVPKTEAESYMKELDELTESRIAIREFEPFEVPAVMSGKEEVPVKLKHGKFIKSFERMIFSYGAPQYGTIDPTPFVAIFFTILFGIMFGDLGQGLVFLLVGILMCAKVIKFGGWEKFGPIFVAIGCTSSFMGLLTGEIFSNETILEPFAEWITGLFGNPHAPILKMMPSQDPNSIKVMFGVFGVAVAVGFVINSIGLIINMINNIIKKNWGEAFLGKNGLSGALFFWYVVALILRIVLLHHKIAFYDWIVLGVTLLLASFAQPIERALAHEKPLLENGVLAYIIGGVVEIIEVISGYLSNTVSFVRVGAFALSHAVLDYMILILTNMCGGPVSVGGIFVLILGNAIIIVLEGMIVAIQVIRLQYYEFFSKFFHETGKEFTPFKFEIN